MVKCVLRCILDNRVIGAAAKYVIILLHFSGAYMQTLGPF